MVAKTPNSLSPPTYLTKSKTPRKSLSLSPTHFQDPTISPCPTPKRKSMGRKRIPVQKIESQRTRQVTFLKRKRGLVKKAMELSVLCDCKVALVIYNKGSVRKAGQLIQYSSIDFDDLLIQLIDKMQTPKEVYRNEDYDRLYNKDGASPTPSPTAGQKRALSDDEDESEDTVCSPTPTSRAERKRSKTARLVNRKSAPPAVVTSSSTTSTSTRSNSRKSLPSPSLAAVAAAARQPNTDAKHATEISTGTPHASATMNSSSTALAALCPNQPQSRHQSSFSKPRDAPPLKELERQGQSPQFQAHSHGQHTPRQRPQTPSQLTPAIPQTASTQHQQPPTEQRDAITAKPSRPPPRSLETMHSSSFSFLNDFIDGALRAQPPSGIPFLTSRNHSLSLQDDRVGDDEFELPSMIDMVKAEGSSDCPDGGDQEEFCFF